MDPKSSSNMPKDVHDLLLSTDEEEGKTQDDEEVVDTRAKKGPFFTTPVIISIVVGVLTLTGLGIIYTNPVLTEQFQAMMAGELGKYKEQLRQAREDKIRDIEMATGNKYGSVALFYSPRDAKVSIEQYRFKLDCAKAGDDDALLNCLRTRVDYTQAPEVKPVDNPSLHLDKAKKEVVEQIPLNDIPIQEGSEDRKALYRYEMKVTIDAEGYYPRTFYFTGDKERPTVSDVELLFWEQKGPGIYMADFRGADLLPKPETAKENFKKARLDIACIDRDVEAKKKEGKNVSEDAVRGAYNEILNKHGFKTFEEWDRIDAELRKDAAWWKSLEEEIKAHKCGV